ncbi:hypothetical protein DVH24_000892 [Malus domestica]|uniref:Uncharacterized protein n=1 Tax=Malus domestica TaxID=3750 RepID=A0A498K054_MALDO|nr:hypothetical protein DVH24_000892 [Malus domestica]
MTLTLLEAVAFLTARLWQASFDEFLGLLTNIINIYIVKEVIGSEATRALHHEMPVELLRASLPHTDEHQRKLLSDFAHRSMPISGLNAHGGSGGRMNSESVRG